MPNKPDPPVRVDRAYFMEVESELMRSLLDVAATMVDAIGIGGTIYPNILLPEEEARRKAAMMAQHTGGQ